MVIDHDSPALTLGRAFSSPSAFTSPADSSYERFGPARTSGIIHARMTRRQLTPPATQPRQQASLVTPEVIVVAALQPAQIPPTSDYNTAPNRLSWPGCGLAMT